MLPVTPTPPATRRAPVDGLVLGVPLVIEISLTVCALCVTLATVAPVTSTQYRLVPSLTY